MLFEQIEGNNANANDAIMLDNDGYVSETNATNIFLVKKGRVLTPHADYCLPGITRATIMELVVKEKFELVERRISLSEFHAADEEHGLHLSNQPEAKRKRVFDLLVFSGMTEHVLNSVENVEI
ncbi:hypothetical protein GOBAR_DD29391 [Gossypium barbadense]|nr:hypothetical protein GOBAR_DD29391 [Gossypium barbadense]